MQRSTELVGGMGVQTLRSPLASRTVSDGGQGRLSGAPCRAARAEPFIEDCDQQQGAANLWTVKITVSPGRILHNKRRHIAAFRDAVRFSMR